MSEKMGKSSKNINKIINDDLDRQIQLQQKAQSAFYKTIVENIK